MSRIPVKYVVKSILDISKEDFYKYGWYMLPNYEGYYTIIGESEKLLANQRTKDLETISDFTGWPVEELRKLIK